MLGYLDRATHEAEGCLRLAAIHAAFTHFDLRRHQEDCRLS